MASSNKKSLLLIKPFASPNKKKKEKEPDHPYGLHHG